MSVLKELKKEGLNIGEEAAMKLVKAVFRAVPKEMAQQVAAGKMNATVGGLVGGILPMLEPVVLEMVDKLDGENDIGPGSAEAESAE